MARRTTRRGRRPSRLPTTRRALPDTRLVEINEVAATTGGDPELDTVLLRPRDLDPNQDVHDFRLAYRVPPQEA
jgi:hypothetical protein